MSKVILALALVVLSGCSLRYQAHDYQAQSGHEPIGHSEVQRSDTEYDVTYESWRSRDRVALQELATRRAAELGQELGYEAFVLQGVQRLVREEFARAGEMATSSRVPGGDGASMMDMPAPSVGMRQLVYSVTLQVRYVPALTEQALSVRTVLARPLP